MGFEDAMPISDLNRVWYHPIPWIYRIALGAGYLLAALMLARRETFYAGLFTLLSVPLGIFAMKAANEKDLATPGLFRANRNTALLHTVGSLALAGGALVPALVQ